jgi:DNA-binding MarR family transcriptional regulator
MRPTHTGCMPRVRTAGPEPPTDHVSRLITSWRVERPDLPVEPVAVVYRVIRLAAYFTAEVEKVLAGSGLSSADFAVLANLRRSRHPYRLSQRQLMDALRLSGGTISVRVDRLAARGFVRRDPDPDDGRGVLVTLTDEGERLFDCLAPEHLANEARLIAALGPDEQSALARLLQVLLVEYEPTDQRPGERLGFTLSAAHVGQQRRAAVGLPAVNGLLVESVRPNTPAAAAGLQAGDLLVRSGDRELRSLTDLALAISAGEASEASQGRVRFRVHRADKTVTVSLPLAAPPSRPTGRSAASPARPAHPGTRGRQ